jgi:P27 family predicted phage terminase small subunit
VRGTQRPGRENAKEPKPEVVAPYRPSYLDADAVAEWERLEPILLRMKVLTEADYIALALICQTHSTMIKAQEQLTKSGILFKTPSGYVQQSPLLAVVNGCVEKIITLCREFGLTPSARFRIQTTPGDGPMPDDEWSQFG